MTDRFRLLLAAVLPAALVISVSAVAQVFTTPPVPPGQLPPGAAAPPPPGAMQSQNQNPTCMRLEGQLAAVERGFADPARAAQVRRAEDAVNRGQADLDRLVAQQRRLGCQTGFFSIFASQPQQCGPLGNQIEQTRSNIDRNMNELQRLQSGSAGEQESQRQTVLAALAQNNCGPQYRQAAASQQRGGFFENLFGGNAGFGGNPMFGGVDVSQGGTFRTICVRTCDGYYYPISFATTPARFAEDEATCRSTCPNAEVALYAHRTNEDVRQATTVNGSPYTSLPNAFKYRTNYDASCSCRRTGQSWNEALGGRDMTIERGDIVVTDEKSKQLSQPRGRQPQRQQQQQQQQPETAAAPQTPASAIEKRSIRTVGPTPYPVR